MSDVADLGGDSACWLDRVCAACGRVVEGDPCPACGRSRTGDDDADGGDEGSTPSDVTDGRG